MQVDYTLYIVDNIDIIKSLKAASTALFQWFDDNLLKSNPGKCHLFSNENISFNICEYLSGNSECERLLCVKLDWKLHSDYHISDICLER